MANPVCGYFQASNFLSHQDGFGGSDGHASGDIGVDLLADLKDLGDALGIFSGSLFGR